MRSTGRVQRNTDEEQVANANQDFPDLKPVDSTRALALFNKYLPLLPNR